MRTAALAWAVAGLTGASGIVVLVRMYETHRQNQSAGRTSKDLDRWRLPTKGGCRDDPSRTCRERQGCPSG